MCFMCDEECPDCHYVIWRAKEGGRQLATWLKAMCEDCKDEVDGAVVDDSLDLAGRMEAYNAWLRGEVPWEEEYEGPAKRPVINNPDMAPTGSWFDNGMEIQPVSPEMEEELRIQQEVDDMAAGKNLKGKPGKEKTKKVKLPLKKGMDNYQATFSKKAIKGDNDDAGAEKSPGNAGEKAGTSKASRLKKMVKK